MMAILRKMDVLARVAGTPAMFEHVGDLKILIRWAQTHITSLLTHPPLQR